MHGSRTLTRIGIVLAAHAAAALLPPQAASQGLCMPRCVSRSASGGCMTFEADYCAIDAACVPKCAVRSASGTCVAYAADFCAPLAACTPACLRRIPTGECQSYADADSCGTSADLRPSCDLCRGQDVCVPGRDCVDRQHRCVPRCLQRAAAGGCASYGADYCGPGAECAVRCMARTPAGICLTYGADFCAARETAVVAASETPWRGDGRNGRYEPRRPPSFARTR